MSLLKKQLIKCCICGIEFATDFTYCGGYVCSPECRKEYEWRKTLFILGEQYKPRK